MAIPNLISSAVLLLAISSAALAGECSPIGLDISPRDVTRLENLKETRSSGIAAALLSTSASDRADVAKLFTLGTGAPKMVRTGKFKCRTIKLGGLTELTSYRFFDCRITQADGGYNIEKLTGSQRFTGKLIPQDGAIAYVGAGHYGYEEPNIYLGDSDRDQVGCLSEALGKPGSYLLELPKPFFESVHDVIEFVPAY